MLQRTCIICQKNIHPNEMLKIAEDFINFPAHSDCFDSFDNSEEFLAFCVKKQAEGSSEYNGPGLQEVDISEK